MDPLQKWNPGLNAEASQMAAAESSQEGTAICWPSSTGQLVMGLSDLSISPGSNPPVPLREGLFEQQYREEKTLPEQHWERLGFPQRKKAFLGHLRRRHRDHMVPYPVERETRVSFPGTRSQNQFRCQCQYCQAHTPNISRVTGERSGTLNPSSWETLVQGLSGLTLSLGSNRPGLQPGGMQQQPPEEKYQLERQQESKSMFQRLFMQWLEEN
ncbi:protein FAM156A/FAM156B [Octodon degus]|uniref:Protein FAM156A/FAM156B n=1 Tax=Octodon degus TaxID=10160 RepID=A0A6P6DVC7_OCTDE|nr:protein FAM156A/FAM156B [Octodon degus]XP_023563942.1 protein FAM156A/FAM156B [Octodon degus]XP_023563943.1 protein FAM156A/FAM156B [Octodon degus]XP_023563944.1 protein FAM156A/FAM156B [Octodon degus]